MSLDFSDLVKKAEKDYERRNTPAAGSKDQNNGTPDEKSAASADAEIINEAEGMLKEKAPEKKARKKQGIRKEEEGKKRMLHLSFPEQDCWHMKMMAASKHMNVTQMVYEWYQKEARKHYGI